RSSYPTSIPPNDDFPRGPSPLVPATLSGLTMGVGRFGYPFRYPFLPAEAGIPAGKLRHRRPVSL
ncbi:MAG TPA: hypothetical protein VII66_00665, partial [Gemmatimonadaceae bacterium]